MRFTRHNLIEAAERAGLTVERLSATLPFPVRIAKNSRNSINLYEDGSCFINGMRLDEVRKMSPRQAAQFLGLPNPEAEEARRNAELADWLARRARGE